MESSQEGVELEGEEGGGIIDETGLIQLRRIDIFWSLRRNLLKHSASSTYSLIEDHVSKILKKSFCLPENIKLAIRRVLNEIQARWRKANFNEQRFIFNYREWLQTYVVLSPGETHGGKSYFPRRMAVFSSVSNRTKRRRTEHIRATACSNELAYATQMSLRSDGRADAAAVIKDVVLGTPTRAKRYKRSISSSSSLAITSDRALRLMLDAHLSKNQHQLIRNALLEVECEAFPPYHHVLKAKQACYPSKSAILVAGNTAEVQVQELLNHTADHMLKSQEEVVAELTPETAENVTLICKWSYDGTSGQSNYKQKFVDELQWTIHLFYSCAITGLDYELINRFRTELQTLSSDYQINSDKFHDFVIETARRFVSLYPWYNMSTTVHKILLHRKAIIAQSALPIGQISEEAQEASNKHIKEFRRYFSRKFSRKKTMEDVFFRLLAHSDPYISNRRTRHQKKLHSISPEAKVQLLSPNLDSCQLRGSVADDADDFLSNSSDSDIEV